MRKVTNKLDLYPTVKAKKDQVTPITVLSLKGMYAEGD